MKNNNNIKPTNWGLIASLLFNSDRKDRISKTDNEKILSETDQLEIGKSRSVSKKIDLYYSQKKYSEDKAWKKIQQKIEKHRKHQLQINTFLRVAAVIAVAFIIGVFVYQHFRPGKIISQQLTACNEPLPAFELADGTVVALNTGSKLTYPTKFKGNTRQVTLEGEAYFEVKPKPTKPFVIDAGEAQIKVLGTSFNVNAYPESEKLEVIVESGKVQVNRKEISKTETNQLVLDPGDKATFLYANNELLKSKNEDVNFLAWKTRVLKFRETPLKDVIKTLEKVYKIEINISDEKLGDILLTGHYENYSIDFILEVITSTLNLQVEPLNGKYLVKKNS